MSIEQLSNLNFNYNLTFEDLKQMPGAFAQKSWEFLKVNRSIFMSANAFMAIASVPLFVTAFSDVSILKDHVLHSITEISKTNIQLISLGLGYRFLWFGEDTPILTLELKKYIFLIFCKIIWKSDLNALKEGCKKFLSLPDLSAKDRFLGHLTYITELKKRGQDEEIISYCEEKLSLAPNNPPELKLILVAYYIDSLIRLNQNDLNALKEGCERFLSLPNLSAKERSVGHEAYIRELEKRGQYEEIISYCDEKLLLAPNNQPELKLILGPSYIHSLRHLNRFGECIEFMRAVLLEFPDLTFLDFGLEKNTFYHTLINNLISLNRWSEVKEASNEAIRECKEEADSGMEEDGAPTSFLDFYIESSNKAKRMLQVADERASLYRRKPQSVDGQDPKIGITFRRKRT